MQPISADVDGDGSAEIVVAAFTGNSNSDRRMRPDIVANIEDGMPLVLTFPEEGTGYEIGGMGIVKDAEHQDAAQKWFDWALEAMDRGNLARLLR